jgi:uncharacterized protein with GYD domain
MPTYISLINWTDQGIKSVKESPKRLDSVREAAQRMGCRMTDFYLTIGPYDLVSIMEAPDDETAAKLMLAIGSAGNVRTTTMKAFTEDSYRDIVSSL